MGYATHLVDLEQRLADVGQLRPRLLELAGSHPTPLYVFDAAEACANLDRFASAYAAAGLPVRIFYAIKSNPCAPLLRTVVQKGHGLDASSQREVELALEAGARDIVMTGPAKSLDDLALACRHTRQVTVNLESAEELKALGELARARRCTVRCGLRLATRHQQRWSKFGVPVQDLKRCWQLGRRYPELLLCGLHFHGGTLETPTPVCRTIAELGRVLPEALTAAELAALRYLDMGGGVTPAAFEGLYPWNRSQVMRFSGGERRRQQILADSVQPHYLPLRVTPIDVYARAVASALRRHLRPRCPNMALCAEPGKYISHSVLHLLFRVAVVRGRQCVIVDAGTNMIGWEKYEYFDYAPIFNLSRHAPKKERPLLVYGNLCTPHDLFGYYLRGHAPRVGDLLCMPYQGAYTFTLAQQFIRAIPEVVELPVLAD